MSVADFEPVSESDSESDSDFESVVVAVLGAASEVVLGMVLVFVFVSAIVSGVMLHLLMAGYSIVLGLYLWYLCLVVVMYLMSLVRLMTVAVMGCHSSCRSARCRQSYRPHPRPRRQYCRLDHRKQLQRCFGHHHVQPLRPARWKSCRLLVEVEMDGESGGSCKED